MTGRTHDVGVGAAVRMHLFASSYGTGNRLRRHLATDHGLADDPEYISHNVSPWRDWRGRHGRYWRRRHSALHGVEWDHSVWGMLLKPWWMAMPGTGRAVGRDAPPEHPPGPDG